MLQLQKEATNINETQNFKNLEKDLIYPKVKRGEVYWCDFGRPYGSEQGFQRYAIVIQNDKGNRYSNTTIVIACTTVRKKIPLPIHLPCKFSSANMIDYDVTRVGSAQNIIMTEQIRTIDKARLRRYIGTLTPEFMKKIESKIDISLHLNREEKTIDKPEAPRGRRDVNITQIQLLSFVNINELLKISQSFYTYDVKVQKILELFGFDFKKNGVQYLLKAIIASPKDTYFNLETLAEILSQDEGVDKEEIKFLIVTTVKENFGFRKSPTIDFIRLVNNVLGKHEEN